MRLSPFDYREAAELHGVSDLRLAVRLYSVIGGVAAYARDMVDDDLPAGPEDFDAWIARRVLSPAAPLFREAELLLSEDPATSTTRKPNLYHATLAGVALGNSAFGRLTRHVGVAGPSLAPILNGLIDSSFVIRLEDPTRENRPLYQPADPLLRFHYAIIRPHQTRFSHASMDALAAWRSLAPRFSSQVVGPCFEAMARDWVQHHADPETLGGFPEHVGATTLEVEGETREVDVVVTSGEGERPAERAVTAIGEAKAGEQLTDRHLRRLEACRTALGDRARDAKLLLVGSKHSPDLVAEARSRSDVELVDLDRLYHGS